MKFTTLVFFAETGEIRVPHVQKPSHPRIGPANADATHLLEEPLESPRHLVWLLLRDSSSVDNQEQQMLAFLRQEQDMKVAYGLEQQFGIMIRTRQRDTLDAWLMACLASRIPDLETFAVGLQKEYALLLTPVFL
jgi:hypothetical protein